MKFRQFKANLSLVWNRLFLLCDKLHTLNQRKAFLVAVIDSVSIARLGENYRAGAENAGYWLSGLGGRECEMLEAGARRGALSGLHQHDVNSWDAAGQQAGTSYIPLHYTQPARQQTQT